MVKNHKQTHVFIQDGICLANGASMFLLDIDHFICLTSIHLHCNVFDQVRVNVCVTYILVGQ
jgi:hypothetical protein